ncbi:hypothetical protein CLU79DRAFT_719197 [Phycomyces nitens]|nr:hypothetical protein CLU79DRAFT_719197 [Phycomyces nitens]
MAHTANGSPTFPDEVVSTPEYDLEPIHCPIDSTVHSEPGNISRPLSCSSLDTFRPPDSVSHEGWIKLKRLVRRKRLSFPPKKRKDELQSSHELLRLNELNVLPPILLATNFQRDEYGKPRIPVLMSQTRVKVSMETHQQNRRSRLPRGYYGPSLLITVYYNLGDPKYQPTWVISRRYWDFVKLHYHCRSYDLSWQRIPEFPDLPRRRFRPVFRNRPDKPIESSSTGLQSQLQTTSTRFKDSGVFGADEPRGSNPGEVSEPNQDQICALESYLEQLLQMTAMTSHINRVCKFLEMSALGILLSSLYPEGYHGKEGYLWITSRTDRDPKHLRRWAIMKAGVSCGLGKRKTGNVPKWFIVRESYIVCVNDPHEYDLFDVFLVDSQFEVQRVVGSPSQPHPKDSRLHAHERKAGHAIWSAAKKLSSGKTTLAIKNLQGGLYLRAKDERQARQFESSIQKMVRESVWSGFHRFDSYAPVRKGCQTTWFVDGRDYLWDVSVAMEHAKHSIYIHDWWLSPELYLRRPATQFPEYRLDQILKRKAEQGVKIYIIIYKEVAMALPLYSHYAKKHLTLLSPNICVQRHPSRALDVLSKSNLLFWAHHEKICVVDNEIAFIGGIDLCFGRWDTPAHSLIDDNDPSLKPDNTRPQMWPGKDYSNPRILDFHSLDKPFEDNMDRSRLPRMPWHDVSMRVCGQPARDIARHFIQRWNFLRRRKQTAPKRLTPLIVPVPDTTFSLSANDPRICHPHTSSSCSVQILRSVSPWSIGFANRVEHSIQNAYVSAIHDSEYFIYIENQFFITSTKLGSTVVENKIGAAIVERILRARAEGKRWRAIILVPLVPGFPSNVDEAEGSTVRLIMHSQYHSISRGPDSIFGRLREAGIKDPQDYLVFYGLRNWGELNGQFVTEQVYIHAKVMIVDDRTVIMGSANINERSLLGSRDSEIAACIKDDELIDSRIGDTPIKVGRFAQTLRLRLMSEHVGIDVDSVEIKDRLAFAALKDPTSPIHPLPAFLTHKALVEVKPPCMSSLHPSYPEDSHEQDSVKMPYSMFDKKRQSKDRHLHFWTSLAKDTKAGCPAPRLPSLDPNAILDLLKDPLSDAFDAFWWGTARGNTDIFRRSFLVMPDNNVQTWDEYDNFVKMAKLFLGRQDVKGNGTQTSAAAASVTTDPGMVFNGQTVRDLLKEIRGHLVVWPLHYMEEEDNDNEFVFNMDKIMPIEIFD